MNDQILARKLIEAGALSDENAIAAVRADFKCEYCGLDFLSSAVNHTL